MGGGGAMRAAAKVAGYGVFSGFRHHPPVPLSEQAAATAMKCTGTASAGDVLSAANGRIEVAAVSVQRPLWEHDDWEFAGGQELEVFDSVHPPPRVVFGKVPTIDEARQATSDLKDALEKVYLSSPTVTGAEGSSTAVLGTGRSGHLNLESLEIKACVTSDSATILPSVPEPVLNAFYLLKESPAAQDVVASLAADKNVWEAVMNNEKVMEFYHSQQASGVLSPHMSADTKESFAANGSAERTSETSGNNFTRFMDSIRLQVAKMVSNLSEFLQNIIGNSAEERSSADAKQGSADFVDKAIGASFIALGILAIMVALLKRK